MNENAFDPNAAAKPGSGIFGLPYAIEDSRIVIVPAPIDITTSYRPGTANGPAAILAASHQVDLYDCEVGEPYKQGIAMLPISSDIVDQNAAMRVFARRIIERGGDIAYEPRLESHRDAVNRYCTQFHQRLQATVSNFLQGSKLVFTLGGDHSVSYGPILAHLEKYPEMGVLHIDAHCDLRPDFEGFRFSHASVFYNVIKNTDLARLVQVGIRDFCCEEHDLIEGSRGGIKAFFWPILEAMLMEGITWKIICDEIVGQLPRLVYISCDIDGLNPALCPHTGTPVPGGLTFDQFSYLLKTLVDSDRTIVGGDLVEVAPGPNGDEWDANVGARVLYKMIGHALNSQK